MSAGLDILIPTNSSEKKIPYQNNCAMTFRSFTASFTSSVYCLLFSIYTHMHYRTQTLKNTRNTCRHTHTSVHITLILTSGKTKQKKTFFACYRRSYCFAVAVAAVVVVLFSLVSNVNNDRCGNENEMIRYLHVCCVSV